MIIFFVLISCSSETKSSIFEESLVEDNDGDGFTGYEDCDDNNSLINPSMEEICDGVDNNCDGVADEEVMTTFYADADNDGFGNELIVTESCDAPSGYVANGSDCNDTNIDAFPGAEEICDGIDNDCNNEIDEGLEIPLFIDVDLDGFGDDNQNIEGCDPELGISTIGGDCDDTDAGISPVANEICDQKDNNCDGNTDEGTLSVFYLDNDLDGFGDPSGSTEACEQPEGYVQNQMDCNDTDTFVHPNATEICDLQDNNCDGDIDEETALDAIFWYADTDEDGFGSPSESQKSCFQPIGFVAESTDCDDTNEEIYTGAQETCNTVDDNCDGEIDESTSLDAVLWYADDDEDGYGDENDTILSCIQPSEYASIAGDCDDNDNDINPLGIEICNSEDDNCDGNIDDATAVNAPVWYVDVDEDGYGINTTTISGCDQPTGYVDNSDDCDDNENGINPQGIEICNSEDDNCDGSIDENIATEIWYIDDDGDGYGTFEDTIERCAQPIGYTDNSDDCNDTDASVLHCSSCLDILSGNLSSASGSYQIDIYGNGTSLDVYCDMDTDDGGWTLVMKQAAYSGFGSPLSVGVWSGWNTVDQVMSETDSSMSDGNMVNYAYSRLNVTELRLTASSNWIDEASGAWIRTVNDTPYNSLSDTNANQFGNLGGTETTPWGAASFTNNGITTTTGSGYGLCWRSGPWFNQTSYEYTSGGVKWGWFFNNECSQSTTDTAEGLGCCGNSSWYRESAWTLYLWGR
jgi:hypothetical protein